MIPADKHLRMHTERTRKEGVPEARDSMLDN
jgi:hypothetical protein